MSESGVDRLHNSTYLMHDFQFLSAVVEQKHQPLTHESSSVGARPSSAAPSNSTLAGCKGSKGQFNRCWLLFEGGGRGRPRSD